MDEIIKIILNCNRERRLLNQDEVISICKIVLNKLHYDNIDKILFAPVCPRDSQCGAITTSDSIVFFNEGSKDIIDKYTSFATDSFNFDCSTVDIINYYYLVIIFHELAHVRQHHLVYDTNYHSYEKRLFTAFFNLPNSSIDRIYENDITEVNANNIASLTATHLYSKFPIEFCSTQDKILFKRLMANMMLFNQYNANHQKEKIIGPAERLINMFTEEDYEQMGLNQFQYEKLIYCNNLTIYKKIMLGLPLTYLEYAYANTLFDGLAEAPGINYVKKLQTKLYE